MAVNFGRSFEGPWRSRAVHPMWWSHFANFGRLHHQHSDRVEKCANGRVAGAFVGRRIALPFEGARGIANIDQQTLVHSLCKFSAESSVSGTLCRPFEMPLPSRARPGPYLLSCQLTCTTWALRFRNFFSFSLIDIDSFVRHRLPVVALFGNDACCAQIARDQVPWFNSAVGCELSHANYDEVGTALGANGIRFEEPIDDAELRDRLWQALAQCQGRRRNSAVAEEKDGAAATTAPPTTMGANRR
ncbi:hypothetical protein niasHT_018872 [Heterodera trifolii]|uniref:Uncharacterized protein n=1 Tax=Heterodera trifolii TaxID=157864 RepID=A0ABD2L7A3_9BILA